MFLLSRNSFTYWGCCGGNPVSVAGWNPSHSARWRRWRGGNSTSTWCALPWYAMIEDIHAIWYIIESYIYISHAMIHTDDINDIWWLLMSPMYSNVTWCVQCKGFPIKVVLRSSLIHVLRIWPAVHWIRLRLRTLGIPMHQGHHLDRPLEPWRSRNLNGTSPKSRQEHSFETDGWIVRGLSLKWRFQTLHQSRRDD